jgi:hypothetical protein
VKNTKFQVIFQVSHITFPKEAQTLSNQLMSKTEDKMGGMNCFSKTEVTIHEVASQLEIPCGSIQGILKDIQNQH